MSSSPYAYQHYLLRSLSTQFRLPETQEIALKPGVQSVYRVTCHYPDVEPPNSVATVVSSVTGSPTFSLYCEYNPDQPDEFILPDEAFKGLVAAFSALKFDRMEDQPNIPVQGANVWLVERAAGSFVKSVLLSPENAEEPHHTLIYRLHEFIPQAVNPIVR